MESHRVAESTLADDEAEVGPKTAVQEHSPGEIVAARDWHFHQRAAPAVPGSSVLVAVEGVAARAQTLFSTWASEHGAPRPPTGGPSFGRCSAAPC